MFKHTLALGIGCFVADIDRMSSAEFSGWLEYAQLFPFGSQRDNMHAALISQAVVNTSLTGSGKAAGIDDFMFKSEIVRERDKLKGLMSFMLQISEVKKDG